MEYHLAQANVAHALAPPGDPLMASYVARLDEINTLADQSPGFVWRYLTDSRDPEQREFDDPLVLFNLSVWETFEALHAYTYKTAHAEVYAGRRRWFNDWKTAVGGPSVVLWWVPAGHRPSAREAKERLALLAARGPTAEAFGLKQRFAPPAQLNTGARGRGALI